MRTGDINNLGYVPTCARKADWTFLNNLATFVGFLFSYFHRFTIGILTQVIILGPFTSQVAVTSLHGLQLNGTSAQLLFCDRYTECPNKMSLSPSEIC